MCCYTHAAPSDARYGGQAAEDDALRCRCGEAVPVARCVRRATAEDRLCDRCRAPEPGWDRGDGYAYPYSEMVMNYRLGLTVARPQPVIVTGVY